MVDENQTELRNGQFAPATVRVGNDLTAIQSVADSIAVYGDRYITRIFTAHEIAYCASDPELAAARFAARFAAKEAVVKVLRPTDARPDWRSIEVHRQPGGWCEINLYDLARDLANRAGITALTVSLSHDGAYASAVVVAQLANATDSPGDS